MPAAKRNLSRDDAIRLHATGTTIRHCRTLMGKQSALAAALAERMGRRETFDNSTVSDWENAKYLPRKSVIDAFRKIFANFNLDLAAAHDDARVRAQFQPGMSGRELRDYLRDGNRDQAGASKMTNPSPVSVDQEKAPSQPRCWMQVNHSTPDVSLVEVEGATREWLARAVEQFYGQLIPRPTHIQRLGHTGHAYLVADADVNLRPLFVKVQRTSPDAAQRRAVEQIQERLFQRSIFQEYSGYVIPVRTRSGARFAVLPDKPVITAFFFVAEVRTGKARHFEGASCDEIEDVAEKYGRLNQLLANSNVEAGITRSFPLDPTRWSNTIRTLRARHELSPAQKMVQAHTSYLESTLGQIRAIARTYRSTKGRAPITLSDFHPHNVFTMNQRCLLIVDLGEARSDWPEVANVAFAVHRFSREYLRRRIALGETAGKSPVPDAMRRSASAFLRGYRRGRPEKVIRSIIRHGTLWAKAANFAKLASILSYSLGIVSDPRQRPAERHEAEMSKFLAFLWELDELEKAGWLDPP